MAYITKDSVQKCLDDLSGENLIGNENDTFISLAEAKDRIEELPTADVVPRSEVASTAHKCEDCAGCIQWECDCSLIEEHAKTEVAREIFGEIDSFFARYDNDKNYFMDNMEYDIAELKKKYTGEQI